MEIFFTYCQLVTLLYDIRLIIRGLDGITSQMAIFFTHCQSVIVLWDMKLILISYKGLLFLYLLLLSIWQTNYNELGLHYFPITVSLYHRCRKHTSLPGTQQRLNPKWQMSQNSRYHRHSPISAQAPINCLHLSTQTACPLPPGWHSSFKNIMSKKSGKISTRDILCFHFKYQ